MRFIQDMLSIVLLVSFFSLGQASLSFSKVEIKDNGYTGLVIAIHPDVEESEALIDAIKASWTEASRDLFIATENRAYFKQITILVPKTWTNKSYSYSTGSENYDQADVVIASANPSFGNEPYTEQHEGCGQPGIRTHFTPTYLREDEYIVNYGRRGKVIVHEWAHYRWGVFDETSETEPFYWDPNFGPENGPVATTCPKDLMGNILNADTNYQTRCSLADIDDTTNSYPENCVFFPAENQYYQINVSMMANQYLEDVVTFCKDADGGNSDSHNVHNADAPNSQNRLCGMRSTWSVIKDSDDYKQWTVNNLNVNTDPSFNVVTPQGLRFVLVLDDSGSMSSPCGSDATRTECLKTAANQFLQCAPSNSSVGIVTFGTSSTITERLTLLDSEDDREDLAQSIVNLNAGSGSTCIGCGIQDGIEVLEYGGNSAAGGRLIVITDGDENQYPRVADVSSEVLSKGVSVDVIFIVNQNNLDLKELSSDSGGETYYTRSQGGLQQIFTGMCSADSTATNSYQIHGATFTVRPTIGFESFVFIDATIGADTVFTFTWSLGNNPPNVYIISPSGCIYSDYPANGSLCVGGDSIHDISIGFSTIKFKIPGIASVGKWTYVVEKQPSVGEMTSLVTSAKRNTDVQPIVVESGMSRTDISTGAAVVYAKVTQGYNPILGASVVATVTGPDLVPKFLDLYDNGAGSDVNEDDGIYSRYFTEFTGPGRYAVDITVSSVPSASGGSNRRRRDTKSNANYRSGVIASDGTVEINPNGAVSNEGNGSSSAGIQSQDLGEFSRIVPSESFDYSGTVDTNSPIPAPDQFPPSKITDLKIQQNDLEDYTQGVVTRFTATGNDFDQGVAAGYEFRYTFDDPSSLIMDFENNKRINETDVIRGNLSDPASTGMSEEFILRTPVLPVDMNGNKVNNSRLAFAIRAYDSSFNYGDPSNVAIINFFIAPLVIPTAPTPEITTLGMLVTTESTTTTKPTVITTTTTTPKESIEPCQECVDYQKEIRLFQRLTAGLAVISAIFVTSTIILAIWLGKSNRQLERKDKNATEMVKKILPRKHRITKVHPASNESALQLPIDDFDF